jgi:hypothetical protein
LGWLVHERKKLENGKLEHSRGKFRDQLRTLTLMNEKMRSSQIHHL